MVNFTMLMLAIHFIVVSNLPLSASCFVLLFILRHAFSHLAWLALPLIGPIDVKDEEFSISENTKRVVKVNFTYVNWFIRLTFDDGSRGLLWRDSVSEAKYRQLIVILKKGQ